MKRTLENCFLIKQTNSKPEQYGGKCTGFGKSETDDEPSEVCKKCRLNVYFEEE